MRHQSKIIRYAKPKSAHSTALTKDTEETDLNTIYESLKKQFKHTSIVNRLSQKTAAKSLVTASHEVKQQPYFISKNIGLNKSTQRNVSAQRPRDAASLMQDFRGLKKQYQKQQISIKQLLDETSSQLRNSQTTKQQKDETQKMKEGLLGEYKYYQKMDKPELIEKLIALEYLTKKLYKRNKYLEKTLAEVDPLKGLGQHRPSFSDTNTTTFA